MVKNKIITIEKKSSEINYIKILSIPNKNIHNLSNWDKFQPTTTFIYQKYKKVSIPANVRH